MAYIKGFVFSVIIALSLFSFSCRHNEENAYAKVLGTDIKPCKVLIIIGDQWTDPMSYSIDPERVRNEDFLDVVTMLKIWGIPFDILRLDEQRLQINRFLDGEARPAYGCMIWMADPERINPLSANFQTLQRAVNEYGISLIALTDYIKNQEISGLIGINYKNATIYQMGNNGLKLEIKGKHFITSGAEGLSLPDIAQLAPSGIPEANGITRAEKKPEDGLSEVSIINCTVDSSAAILGTIGDIPQFVVKAIDEDTKAIWIGGGKDWFRKYPAMRKLFRKAIVYAIGYGVFNDNFENGFICIMDDIGCAEHAWSLTWHYPTPAKDTLIKYLIRPLEKYGFMMVQNVVPGFANPEKRMIESPWTVPPFRDIFGNWQDYGSTKEGLDEGLRRGVFEIQAHRAWSHMNWDLESPPGPFWGQPEGEMRITDWYNEVVDVRRDHAPVPSNDLLFIYKTGIDAIKKSFGVIPLSAEVRPGAELEPGKPGGYDNGRVAAIAGIGVSRECYVGTDHTIEFRMMMPEQFTFHDLDLTAQSDGIADETEAGWDNLMTLSAGQLRGSKIAGGRRLNVHDNTDWIESRKDKRWMGFNETCAYLHTQVSDSGPGNFEIKLKYDDHYCRFFEKKPSFWTIEFSDHFITRPDKVRFSIDGRESGEKVSAVNKITVPAGPGEHTITLINN